MSGEQERNETAEKDTKEKVKEKLEEVREDLIRINHSRIRPAHILGSAVLVCLLCYFIARCAV